MYKNTKKYQVSFKCPSCSSQNVLIMDDTYNGNVEVTPIPCTTCLFMVQVNKYSFGMICNDCGGTSCHECCVTFPFNY